MITDKAIPKVILIILDLLCLILSIKIDPQQDLLGEGYIEIDRIDSGISVTDMSADVGIEVSLINSNNPRLLIDNVSAQLLGGTISSNKIEWLYPQDTAFDIELYELSLAEILAVKYQTSLAASGNLSAALPALISNGQLVIKGTQLLLAMV